LLSQILGAIARTTSGIKYKILTYDTSDDNVKLFKSIDWAYKPCVVAFKYLSPVIIIDVRFLSCRYKGRLLISCGYDAQNKLLPLEFGIVNEKNMNNWGWFMRLVCNELIQFNIKICIISDRHRGIKGVFQQLHLGWSVQRGEAIHRYYMQHVTEILLKEAKKSGKKEEDNLRVILEGD
jgi:MULE transposase domain